jgi:hypothetical protein
MLKSRLQKLDGLTHAELKENITKTMRNISKEKYRNIIKGAYERPEKYVSKKKQYTKNQEELFMSSHIKWAF